MATTSFQGGGYPGRPYGSFAGKAAAANPAGPHNPGRITTLWGYGGPGHLYGSFAGKEESTPVAPPIVVVTEKTGTGGIDPVRAYKPTGLLERHLKPDVQRRIDETHEIAAEIREEAARKFLDAEPDVGREFAPIESMSLAEIDFEIGVLLHKQVRSEEDELMLMLLMIGASL